MLIFAPMCKEVSFKMKIIEDISYGQHPEQELDIYIPDCEEFPVFVFLHGGGLEKVTRKKFRFCSDLAQKGIAVVSGEYRKYPDAKYPDFINDGAAVVAWAKENMCKYGKVRALYVGGSSAGAYITQMLCFNEEYLKNVGMSNSDIAGYYHDAGQPTVHFKVLRERGIDKRSVVIDEAAPLYHLKETPYPPMELVVSDNDIKSRYEQTMLLISTLEHFGHNMDTITVDLRKNSKHTEYLKLTDESGKHIYADMIYDFIDRTEKRGQNNGR